MYRQTRFNTKRDFSRLTDNCLFKKVSREPALLWEEQLKLKCMQIRPNVLGLLTAVGKDNDRMNSGWKFRFLGLGEGGRGGPCLL